MSRLLFASLTPHAPHAPHRFCILCFIPPPVAAYTIAATHMRLLSVINHECIHLTFACRRHQQQHRQQHQQKQLQLQLEQQPISIGSERAGAAESDNATDLSQLFRAKTVSQSQPVPKDTHHSRYTAQAASLVAASSAWLLRQQRQLQEERRRRTAQSAGSGSCCSQATSAAK